MKPKGIASFTGSFVGSGAGGGVCSFLTSCAMNPTGRFFAASAALASSCLFTTSSSDVWRPVASDVCSRHRKQYSGGIEYQSVEEKMVSIEVPK